MLLVVFVSFAQRTACFFVYDCVQREKTAYCWLSVDGVATVVIVASYYVHHMDGRSFVSNVDSKGPRSFCTVFFSSCGVNGAFFCSHHQYVLFVIFFSKPCDLVAFSRMHRFYVATLSKAIYTCSWLTPAAFHSAFTFAATPMTDNDKKPRCFFTKNTIY